MESILHCVFKVCGMRPVVFQTSSHLVHYQMLNNIHLRGLFSISNANHVIWQQWCSRTYLHNRIPTYVHVIEVQQH